MERFEPHRENNMTGGNEIPKSMQKDNSPKRSPAADPATARDGFDNTGTQGYDSLSDEGYIGTAGDVVKGNPQSRTGSSSEDFHEVKNDNVELSDEDRALDSGI